MHALAVFCFRWAQLHWCTCWEYSNLERSLYFRLATAVVAYSSIQAIVGFLSYVLHQEATRFGLFILHQASCFVSGGLRCTGAPAENAASRAGYFGLVASACYDVMLKSCHCLLQGLYVSG
jgi:hypothetical protein